MSEPGTETSAPLVTTKWPGSLRPGWLRMVDIRQPCREAPSNREVKPAWAMNGAARLSASRRASAVPVSIGFGEPTVGNSEGPAA